MWFWSVSVFQGIWTLPPSSKGLFAGFMLCFCPIFWLRDINIYLVFPGFTSRPASLLASDKASAFLGAKSHVHFSALGSFCQRIRPGPRLYDTFRNKLEFLRWWVVSPPPNLQAGGPPPVGCPRLLIQYIRSYLPYLEAISSIHSLRMGHAVVTGDPLNMVCRTTTAKFLLCLNAT
jgi:hypothetical protein